MLQDAGPFVVFRSGKGGGEGVREGLTPVL